jgi:hypothetical protein
MNLRACCFIAVVTACGPTMRPTDDDNGPCSPGAVAECYSGQDGTEGVGPCHAGKKTCQSDKTWGGCNNEVVPARENCTDSVDNNCNGMTDEDLDLDGDGFTTCSGNDCCDSTECGDPELVNEGAYDAAGNSVDDDCNGVIDDSMPVCDDGLASNSQAGMDFAKALDVCQAATASDRRWGVLEAKLSHADGNGNPDPEGHAIRPKFGTNGLPQGGTRLAILSTGGAAAKGDTNPGYHEWVGGYAHRVPNTSDFPQDFIAANGGNLPNAPGCPGPSGDYASDPQMLTLRVRVPTNAQSFKFSTNFFSSEFPEYTCSRYNDFFVVLLDSTYAGSPGNPSDKNLAFYQDPSTMMKYPVGVNLAYGNTGLFTQCVNGRTGCSGKAGNIMTCTGTDLLANTGMDKAAPNQCDGNSLEGGATGWLTTSGNVVPGETITLRIAIWDTSDHNRDSAALIDGFQWSTELATPGTVIE